MKRPLLNCDIGESFGAWSMGLDEDIMPLIDCANIACGFHAGDPGTMRRTVSLAARHGVQVGAHPAYPDLVGFGRRSMACSPQEIEDFVLYQLGALDAMCRAEAIQVRYVKPHGALYNDMMVDQERLRAVMRAVHAYDPALPLMLMSTSNPAPSQELASECGVTLLFEAFADRSYDAHGHLLNRRLPGAVHHDPEQVVAQALLLARGEPLIASDGNSLHLQVDTLCVHGDNPAALLAVRKIRQALDEVSV